MTGIHHKIVPGDKRILDPDQFGLVGQILNVVADRTTTDGAGNPVVINTDQNTVLVAPVRFDEVGLTKIQRTLQTSRKLNAHNQYSPSIITIAIESTVAQLQENGGSGHATETLLQGILRYGTGMANQGTQSGKFLTFADIELDPRIIFDIQLGTMLSFPASYFQLDLLYTSVGVGMFGTVGDPLGPNYQVQYSLGYEPQGNSLPVTMTQLHPASSLESGGGGDTFFFRPKYSTHLYFTWFVWTTGAVLDILFYNANGTGMMNITAYPGGVSPPAIIPWPAEAVAVRVQQSSGSPYGNFRCVSILDF